MSVVEIAIAKMASAIGGTIGGAVLMAYLKPKTVTDAYVRGAVSTSSAMVGAAPLLSQLNKPWHDFEWLVLAGFVIGFCAWFVLGAIARWFDKQKHKDAVNVIKDFRK